LGADELAVVARELVGAVGANLAMMIHCPRSLTGGFTMREIHLKIRIEASWPLRQHARQISIGREGSLPRNIPERA
jgi:hypothetical protein